MRSPLFVFPSRQFSQPHLRHEERLSYVLKSCQRVQRKQSDTERGQAQFSDCEPKRGHKERNMTIVECPKMQAPARELWGENRMKRNRNARSCVSATICLHRFPQ